jgi:hypothetical protein
VSNLPSSDGPRARPLPPWTRRTRPSLYERLSIWSALPGCQFRFGVCSSAVGALTHWTGLRTLPCIGKDNGCDWCEKTELRVKWFLGAWAMQGHGAKNWGRGRCIVEVTDSARGDCPAISAPIDTIRGRTLYVARLGPRANGRVTCWMSDEICAEANRTGDVAVQKTLVGIWGHGPGAVKQVFCEQMLSEVATAVALQGGDK